MKIAAAFLALVAKVYADGHAEMMEYVVGPCAEHVDMTQDGIKGTVYLDMNEDLMHNSSEPGVGGVMVSDGLNVVRTDCDGNYMLPLPSAEEEKAGFSVFITEPDGYDVPRSHDNVPQFFYIHKPEGSPLNVRGEKFRYGGLEPTGPLPEFINFPLMKVRPLKTTPFKVVTSGDPQVYSNTELGYMRDTLVKEIVGMDMLQVVIVEGDVMGDDLDMYPRFREIVSLAGLPQYYVHGNHDLDFDAESDADSADTFRREFGPEYYSFDIGMVHFIVLDNVRYPCDASDNADGLHEFCETGITYNGVVSERQLEWLKNDLANVPKNRLIFLNHHIPFYSFIDQNLVKHSISNGIDLFEALGCHRAADMKFHADDCERKIVSLSAHTHTNENMLPGESYEGFSVALGDRAAGPPPYHQVILGASSGSWWSGDFNVDSIPDSIQRNGSPKGYYIWEFTGNNYVDSFKASGMDADRQMSVDIVTPEFTAWFEELKKFHQESPELDAKPPVNINTLADTKILIKDEVKDSKLSVNVWNGSRESVVRASFNGAPFTTECSRTNPGNGENMLETLDPYALKRQMQVARFAYTTSNAETRANGWELFRGSGRCGGKGVSCTPRPMAAWMWTDQSSHIWHCDLPDRLEVGSHSVTVETVDKNGRRYTEKLMFEIVEDERPYPFFDVKGLFDVYP